MEYKKNNYQRFKTLECRVINYDSKLKILDIDFKGYGMRLHNVDNFTGDIATIKYKSDIGKPDFKYFL